MNRSESDDQGIKAFHAVPSAPPAPVKLVPAAFKAVMSLKVEGPIKLKNLSDLTGYVSCIAITDCVHGNPQHYRLTPYIATHLKKELMTLSTLHTGSSSKYLDLLRSQFITESYTPLSVLEHTTQPFFHKVSRAWDMTTKEGLIVVITYTLQLEIQTTRHQFRDIMRSRNMICCSSPEPLMTSSISSILAQQVNNDRFDTDEAARTVLTQLKTFKAASTTLSLQDPMTSTTLPSPFWGIPHGSGAIQQHNPRNRQIPKMGASQARH